MQKIKLFCFPYAGGSAVIYSKWKKMLDGCIEIFPIELAGRGKRIQVPFYSGITDAVEDVYSMIKGEIRSTPYAFFGHSMGSLIAYELAHKIMLQGQPGPYHIFFSGRSAPHRIRDERILHNLPYEEFKEELLELEGTPKEFFEHKELLDIFIPLLRADFRIVENYQYIPKQKKLDCKCTVLYGTNDDMDFEDASGWAEHTCQECKIESFESGHFFIASQIERVTDIINKTLVNSVPYDR